MYQRKEIKKSARKVLKKHYLVFVGLLFVAAVLGTKFSGALAIFSFNANSELGMTTQNVFSHIFQGDIEGALDIAASNKAFLADQSYKIGNVEFGHQEGVFADVVNNFSSGSFFAALASALLNFIGKPNWVGLLFSVLALLFVAFVLLFVTEVYQIIYTRLFLEGRTYEKTSMSSLFFLIRTKSWIHVALAYFRYNFYLFLWNLTIVGGLIKHYSYAAVRFILAENPTISGREAINLSRRMMKGHKWELFKLDLSFLGWDILSLLTGQVLKILYVAPYKESVYAEYYSYIRNLAVENETEGAHFLKDVYLFEKAPSDEIDRAYGDVLEIMTEPDMTLKQPTKIRAFFQNVFGVVLWYDKQELQYRKEMTKKAGVLSYKNAIDKKAYPLRLCPFEVRPEKSALEHTLYMRHYSLTSLILIFITFCFSGWIWEVTFHIVNYGTFVNRGVLHGPWLPIYGVGAVLILMVLNKFRERPGLEFLTAIVLCGTVEYFTSWALEKLFDGAKWWDYTGYFLNINGRICAEGLLVFGVAGIAAVYFVAPLLDNLFSKIKERVKIPLCTIIMVIFLADVIFSQFVPNTGKGVSSYSVSEESEKF